MYPLETLCQFTFATKMYACQFGHSLEATGNLHIHTHTEHTQTHVCVCVCVCAKAKACKTKAFSTLTQYGM